MICRFYIWGNEYCRRERLRSDTGSSSDLKIRYSREAFPQLKNKTKQKTHLLIQTNKRRDNKTHKYIEIKQHKAEQPMEQNRNQKGNLKTIETNKNGNRHTKTYRMQRRQF